MSTKIDVTKNSKSNLRKKSQISKNQILHGKCSHANRYNHFSNYSNIR